jgi:hypothetical protein
MPADKLCPCKNLTGHCWDLGGFKNQQSEDIFGKRYKSVPAAALQINYKSGLQILSTEERRMENELKNIDIDKLPLPKLVEALRQAAKSCQCEGTRETVFTARGRDNVVNCLACEPIYDAIELLEKARKILQPGR